MKCKKISVLILSTLLFFNISVYAQDTFRPSNVTNIIRELTSSKYQGRLSGDTGGNLAAQYIFDYFKNLGFAPGGDNNTYFQRFDIYSPVVNGPCYFKVFDTEGKLVKEYKYAVDFKEDTSGDSSPGTVKGKISIHDENSTGPSPSNILLFPYTPMPRIGETPAIYSEDITLKSQGIDAIIEAMPPGSDFRKRGHVKDQSPHPEGPVKIRIASGIYNELTDFSKKGYTFEIKSTLEIKKLTTSNVVAILEGKDRSLPPIIFGGHYDHSGIDADGAIYPGAFDNASGTAFMMECAKVLKGSGIPDRTIIFVAFSGEEEGLIGSQYFAAHPPMDISKGEMINFDMVGPVKNIPLKIVYSSNVDGLARKLLDIAKSYDIDATAEVEEGSDHTPFSYRGIEAVTFFYDDRGPNYHSVMDTIDNFNENNLKDMFLILHSYLDTEHLVLASPYPDAKRTESGPLYLLICAAGFSLVAVGVYAYKKKKK